MAADAPAVAGSSGDLEKRIQATKERCECGQGGTALSHADLKHGSEAATVRQYLDNGNRIEVWWNPSNAHRIELCQVDKDLYGLRVLKNVDGKWEEITDFLKSKMSNLSQVEQYLTNSGATKIWVK